MKLMFAIKKLSGAVGGAERVLCMICSELVKRGHDVTIVSFDAEGGSAFYYLDKRVKRVELDIGEPGLPARVGVTLIRMKALRKIALDLEPDVCVGFMHSIFVPLSFAMLGLSIPVIASEHIVPEHYKTRPFQYLLLVISSLFVSRITVLSEKIKSDYPILVRRRMIVMPNPIELVGSNRELVDCKSSSTLLCVGRLEEQKDHATLIHAFSKIESNFPEWKLKIVGDGSLRSILEQLIGNLGLNSRIELPGVTDNIEKEYSSASVFVLPSRYEALGLVTAEAMSHGLPTVGFADCPGTNELIEHKVTGLLVEAGSSRVDSLALALTSIMSDEQLRKTLGKNGKKMIGEHYSFAHIIDLWEGALYCSDNIKRLGN